MGHKLYNRHGLLNHFWINFPQAGIAHSRKEDTTGATQANKYKIYNTMHPFQVKYNY